MMGHIVTNVMHRFRVDRTSDFATENVITIFTMKKGEKAKLIFDPILKVI